jgi:Skp family chaperone for outer membrane proteins
VAIGIAATLALTGAVALPGTTAAQDGKIVLVDVAGMLAKSLGGVAAREQFEREKATVQQEIDARRKELEALKDELDMKGRS